MAVKSKERVTVVWRDDPGAKTLNVLVYKPEGTIRTYEPELLDPRIEVGGRADNVEDAITFLRKANGKKLVVPVSLAKKLGDKSWRFEERY